MRSKLSANCSSSNDDRRTRFTLYSASPSSDPQQTGQGLCTIPQTASEIHILVGSELRRVSSGDLWAYDFNSFIDKPFEPAQLRTIIANAPQR